MRLIPVIDLKDGVVVHAQRGQRDSYLPIHSFSGEKDHAPNSSH